MVVRGRFYDLFQGIIRPFIEGEEGFDHVHVLVRLNREEYYLVYVIAEAVEEVILQSEVKLAKECNT